MTDENESIEKETNTDVAGRVNALVRLRDVIEILKEYSDLMDLKYREIRKPTHGTCCTCQDCGHDHDECVCNHNEILHIIKMMPEFKQAPEWNEDMKTSPKNNTPVLLRFKNNLSEYKAREAWNGRVIVGKNAGDVMGWSFAAPVGAGGFPDDWFEGWRAI